MELTFTNLDGLGASAGDIMNISLDMKSTVAGKGVTFQMVYPSELIIEDAPVRPPEGYYDPASPIHLNHNLKIHQKVLFLIQMRVLLKQNHLAQ